MAWQKKLPVISMVGGDRKECFKKGSFGNQVALIWKHGPLLNLDPCTLSRIFRSFWATLKAYISQGGAWWCVVEVPTCLIDLQLSLPPFSCHWSAQLLRYDEITLAGNSNSAKGVWVNFCNLFWESPSLPTHLSWPLKIAMTSLFSFSAWEKLILIWTAYAICWWCCWTT